MNTNIEIENKPKAEKPKSTRLSRHAAHRTSISVDIVDRDLMNEMMESRGGYDSQATFFKHLIQNAFSADLFNDDDAAKVKKAAEISGMSYESIIVSGALKYAEQLIEATKTEMPRADLKIHQFVERIIENNETAPNWWDKVEITQGLLAKPERDGGTGCNRANIQRYLAANKARIDAHHAKHKIEPDHNRRAHNENRKKSGV